jgi:hypothetical protein
MEIWLGENSTVKLVLLCKFSEHPVYRTPKSVSQAVSAIKNLSLDEAESHIADATIERDGQTFIHNARFVGQISGFMEIWARDSQTGEGILRGNRVVSDNDSLPISN